MNWITSLLACLLLVAEVAGQNVPMTQRWRREIPTAEFSGHAIAHDSRSVITAMTSGHIAVLDALTGDTIATWRGHDSEIRSIDASPVNDFFATCSDTEVKVWSLSTRSLVRMIPVVAKSPSINSGLAISPSGSKVAVGRGGFGLMVYDVLTGDSLSMFSTSVRKRILLPGDSIMLIGVQTGPSTHLARFVNIYTQAVVDEYTVDAPIHTMDLSADGRYLLVSMDETVQIIDRQEMKTVWSKGTFQTSDDGSTAMISRGGGHVFLGRLPGAGGEIVGLQLIHWPTNTEVGRWPDGTAPSGKLAPDSSFCSAAYSVTTYAVTLGWQPSSVNEEILDTIVVESSEAGILVRRIPETVPLLQWSLTDITGRLTATGTSARAANAFIIVPQPKPVRGVYMLQCSTATGVIGSWTMYLD